MAASGLPYARSVVLVSLILSVSSASHVVAAGHLPAAGVMVLFGVLLLVPTLLMARRTLTLRSSLVAMGSGQMLLHHLFGMTAVPAVCQSSSATPGHHAAFELACSPVASEQLGAGTAPAMIVLHAIATLILAFAVARSDTAVELLHAWLRPLLAPPVVPPLAAPAHRPAPDATAPLAPLSVHAAVPTLRGPPALVLSPA
ncbi:hypothetical protein [Arthrobacter sp. B1805]|uniref:hypothetical protein n=1 Tax=Arthrobacter sp. B1805 TaxID=2058892 RepID=UPI0011B06D58|nr:hypothetical protein [Arthrobacter sp. B1805]